MESIHRRGAPARSRWLPACAAGDSAERHCPSRVVINSIARKPAEVTKPSSPCSAWIIRAASPSAELLPLIYDVTRAPVAHSQRLLNIVVCDHTRSRAPPIERSAACKSHRHRVHTAEGSAHRIASVSSPGPARSPASASRHPTPFLVCPRLVVRWNCPAVSAARALRSSRRERQRLRIASRFC